jgi:hypothetical protein
MAKVLSATTDAAIRAKSGAHHYRFIGLEVGVLDSVALNYSVLVIGESETSLERLPHDITIDRCYIHGNYTGNNKRGLEFNGISLAIIDSYVSNFHVVGQDTQAILGWNGPGPFKIVNNYLEAAGENVMFGGAAPAIAGVIPSDIEIRRNHFFKPLSWMVGSPSYAGIHWSVKNLFELKIAQRVLIQDNVLENNWVDGQVGFAFLVTPRTELGAAPWVVVQDVTFVYNVVRHTASGVNISGLDSFDPQQLVRGKRVLIQNNLFDDVNGTTYGGGDGRLFQVLSAADAITIDHNTGFQSNQIVFADGPPSTNFSFQNNLTPHNLYGVFGSGAGTGIPALNTYFPGYVLSYNVIENILPSGVSPSAYPPNNFFPGTWTDVRFANQAAGDYRLCQGAGNPVASCPGASPYASSGSDGKDIGADIAGLDTAIVGVI